MKERLRRVVFGTVGLVVAGLSYAAFWVYTGISVPCPFHAVTGLECPGCGVSRMSLALLQFDVVAAFHYNPGLFIVIPIIAAVLLSSTLRYIKTGSSLLNKFENATLIILLLWLIIWGILRNIYF